MTIAVFVLGTVLISSGSTKLYAEFALLVGVSAAVLAMVCGWLGHIRIRPRDAAGAVLFTAAYEAILGGIRRFL